MQPFNDGGNLSQLIFSPDPLSRFQYEKVHGKKESQADDQALRALMFALLEDAVACFQGRFFKPSRTNDKLFQEADEWIYSDDDGVFSFNNVCETLGLHPENLRKGLEQWKARQTGIPWEERKRLILSKGKCLGKKNSLKPDLPPMNVRGSPRENKGRSVRGWPRKGVSSLIHYKGGGAKS